MHFWQFDDIRIQRMIRLILQRAGVNVPALTGAVKNAVDRLPKVEGQGAEVNVSRDLAALRDSLALLPPGLALEELDRRLQHGRLADVVQQRAGEGVRARVPERRVLRRLAVCTCR